MPTSFPAHNSHFCFKMSKVYTLEEVSQHSTKKDLWIVVHNKGRTTLFSVLVNLNISNAIPVYDISNYLEDHPGGGEILVEVAGTDATESFEEVGHSDEARELLKPFLIGELPPDVSCHNISSLHCLTSGCLVLS